ncbi:MAG: DUF4258 domain-containing protein [Flavobacteriaceae bacterium]|nr:DUF4258 domain-containing protein [Flavobacteriaceae bacterium]
MLLKRVGYYLVGLAIGTIAVSFFWKKKDASFDYGMDARTLKSIRIKDRIYSKDAEKTLREYNIDTAKISSVLKFADVDFGKSKPRQKPCAEYFITGKDSLNHISLYVTRCDSTATINKIMINN